MSSPGRSRGPRTGGGEEDGGEEEEEEGERVGLAFGGDNNVGVGLLIMLWIITCWYVIIMRASKERGSNRAELCMGGIHLCVCGYGGERRIKNRAALIGCIL